ncbi:MAG: glucose 1-dehydrogenase [Planctomycetaceae bacterium]|nr:glucose 1-dehydrogenase [Planctomycetaceae bacterium]
MRFHNRVVIVTGGAKGIGAGCASVFAAEGGIVSILDIDATTAESLAAELTSQGPGRVTAIPCDVSQPEHIREAIEETAAMHGRLDCIINNAGAHPPATAIDDTRIEDVVSLFELNFLGTYAGCKYAVPHLRKTRGTIVNVSSMTAVLGQDRSSAYAATKGAQLSLTKALAVELGPQGIRVNAVLPSNVDTPLMHDWARTLDDPASALQRVAELQVFGRMASPEEIGRVCLFLATDDSSFVTGQGIEVEGGASLDY